MLTIGLPMTCHMCMCNITSQKSYTDTSIHYRLAYITSDVENEPDNQI